jgi:tRNA(adenine34) deaminase
MQHEHFMTIALKAAKQALSAGEFPVGCVMVYQNKVITTAARTGTSGMTANEVDHAEMTALKQLTSIDWGIEWPRVSIYTTLEPCLMCYGALLIHGIGTIVYAYEDAMGGGTCCDVASLAPLYRNRQPSIVKHVLRNESLQLFKTFFQDPNNSYWQGSPLAQYTIAQ